MKPRFGPCSSPPRASGQVPPTCLKRGLLSLIVVAGCLAAAPALGSEQKSEQQLMHLLVQDCGSCHGLRMLGGLGPPLTPDVLEPIPRSTLTTTILHGRPGTAMPPWRDILTPDQAEWIVNRLLEGLPTP